MYGERDGELLICANCITWSPSPKFREGSLEHAHGFGVLKSLDLEYFMGVLGEVPPIRLVFGDSEAPYYWPLSGYSLSAPGL